MEILNHVVSGDSRMLTAVDYVTGLLLHDTCNILLRIIKDLLGYQEEKVDRFIQLLEVTRNFLKVQFISHARKKDGCCTHGMDFGLSKPQNYVEQYESDGESNSDSEFEDDSSQDEGVNQDDADNNHPEFTCSACKFPFYFLQKLSDEIELGHQHRLERIGSVDSHNDKLEDVRSVIRNAHEKFYLFMAHKTRVVQAQDAAALIDESMQQDVQESKQNGTKLMVVIDWKMKFEPVSYRESTSEHYGKRGISWHGVFAYFYRYASDESTGEEYVERVVVKADQIMNGESNQDGEAVLSMAEAFLCTAGETFPFLVSAVFCSDNAGCYHKKEFVFGCAVLNLVKSRSIRID
jgi:hypothetical protein